MSSDTSMESMRTCGPLRFGIDAILAVTKSPSLSPKQDRYCLLSPKQDTGSSLSTKRDIGSTLKPKQDIGSTLKLDLVRNNENTTAALFGEDDVDIDSGLDSDESREGFNVQEDCKAVTGPLGKGHKRTYYAVEGGFRGNKPEIEDRVSEESEVRSLFVTTHSHSAAMTNFATAESTPLPISPIIPAGPYTVRPSTAQDSVRQPSIVQSHHPRSVQNSVSGFAGLSSIARTELSSTVRTELSSIAHTELSSIARAAQLSHIFRESSFPPSSIPHTGQLNLDIIRSASTIQASIAQAYALNVLSQLRPQSTVCPWTSEVPKVDSGGFAANPGGLQLSQESAEVADSSIYSSWPSIHRDRYGVVRRIGHPYQNRTPPKRKKPRTSFSRSQIVELEKRFHRQKYLASAERSSLAKQLKMTDAQVKTWFQNRRTKWRRQTAEEREMERREANKFLFSLREDETV